MLHKNLRALMLSSFSVALFAGCTEPPPTTSRLSFEPNDGELDLSINFDIGPDTESIELTLSGDAATFERIAFHDVAAEIDVWSGRELDAEAARQLFVTRNAGELLVTLVDGDVELQLDHRGGGTYALTTQDLTATAHGDGDVSLTETLYEDASPTDTISAIAARTVTVNMAYTQAALAKIGSEATLVSQFSTGLARMSEALHNSDIDARVVLGQVVPVVYTEPPTLKETVAAMEKRLVPGLPIPSRGNKTMLVTASRDPNYAGWAQVGGRYTAIKVGTVSTLLVAHEVGHTVNAVHQHGMQFANGNHTVMLPLGNAGREPVYTNPNVTWLGQAAGDATHFNAARIRSHIGLNTAETIIDNPSSATSRTGTWTVSTSSGGYAGQSLYSNSGTFRFTPGFTTARSYAVYAWWTYHANRSTNVPYAIRKADGSTQTITKNQRDSALAGKWVLLGTFSLGTGSYVQVSAQNGQACADAVRFVPQ